MVASSDIDAQNVTLNLSDWDIPVDATNVGEAFDADTMTWTIGDITAGSDVTLELT